MRYLTFVHQVVVVAVVFAAVAVEAIRNDDARPDKENLILEEERRGAEKAETLKEEKQDLEKSQTNRGLFVTTGFRGHRPQTTGYGYDISSYGASGPEYHYGSSGGGSVLHRPGSYPESGYGVSYHHSIGGGPEEYGHSGPGPGSVISSPHHHQHENGYNALALKKLLLPLAGLVLLGAATALTANPILLQLGVVSGKRRKRETREDLINRLHGRVARHVR